MKLTIDNQNYLILDPNLGGKILELRLLGRLIMQGSLQKQLGNGSYLMYPWVNRVQTHPFSQNSPFHDGNGIPLHGFYVSSPRKVTVNHNPESIMVDLEPITIINDVPKFTQRLTLTKGRFHQKIKIEKSQNQKIPICFGYHPYLQIDNKDLSTLKIRTDVKTNIKLDEKLMVIYPYQKADIEIGFDKKYDDLFQGGTFLEIATTDNFHVKITSHLPYWQIYTPPDGKRIAVEPMSFTGNVYKISEAGFAPTLSSGEYYIEAWSQ